jgi:hypothetical protein
VTGEVLLNTRPRHQNHSDIASKVTLDRRHLPLLILSARRFASDMKLLSQRSLRSVCIVGRSAEALGKRSGFSQYINEPLASLINLLFSGRSVVDFEML